jgi:hypothetical protein
VELTEIASRRSTASRRRSPTATSSNAASSGSTGAAGRDRAPSLPRPAIARCRGVAGNPVGTAKSRLHRALGQMRAALEADARSVRELREGRPA